MAKSRISPETRAAAVADLQAGEQPAVVAAKYGLDAAQMRVWKQRYVTPDVTPAPPNVTPDVTPKRPSIEAQQLEIGALVLELLAAKLKASRAIAEAAADLEWLKRHTPAEVAPLAEWLDRTAFAIGDRLAAGAHDQRADRPGADEPPAAPRRDD